MNGRPNLKKKRIRKNITCDADSISMRYGDETKPLVKVAEHSFAGGQRKRARRRVF